jgi:hypothetical protein
MYHLIIWTNQHKSVTKLTAGTQRQQVFVLDSTTDGHVKRRTNTPLQHPWETIVRTASCIFSNGSREFSTSWTVRRHSVMVGWLVNNWTGKNFTRLDRGYLRNEANICLEGLGKAQKRPQVIHLEECGTQVQSVEEHSQRYIWRRTKFCTVSPKTFSINSATSCSHASVHMRPAESNG